jgi:hypothetical protein
MIKEFPQNFPIIPHFKKFQFKTPSRKILINFLTDQIISQRKSPSSFSQKPEKEIKLKNFNLDKTFMTIRSHCHHFQQRISKVESKKYYRITFQKLKHCINLTLLCKWHATKSFLHFMLRKLLEKKLKWIFLI